jgi:hypothetical protein
MGSIARILGYSAIQRSSSVRRCAARCSSGRASADMPSRAKQTARQSWPALAAAISSRTPSRSRNCSPLGFPITDPRCYTRGAPRRRVRHFHPRRPRADLSPSAGAGRIETFGEHVRARRPARRCGDSDSIVSVGGRLDGRPIRGGAETVARRHHWPPPRFARGRLPARAPFTIAGNAGDHRTNFHRPRIFRGFDTVERYGLGGFVWPINASLARYFDRYDASLVERRYLEMCQQAAIGYLGIRPLFREHPKGLATDEAIAYS